MLARLLIALLCLLAAAPGTAGESAPVSSGQITARLVASAAAVAPGDSVSLAFVQDIAPGWHTYWRNPGDSGAPATLAWELPQDATIGPPQWPAPEAIPYFGLMTYGHHGRFALLHELAIPSDWPIGTPFPIRLAADWLVCAEICIPESGGFALDLPTGPTTLPAAAELAALLAEAETRLPRPLPWATRFNADASLLRLETELTAPLAGLREARFFPHAPALIDQVADPSWRQDGQGLVLDMALQRPDTLAEPLAGVLVLTEALADGELRQAFTVEAPRDPGLGLSPAASAAASADAGQGLLQLTFLALLGGLVLNLMPCVFPILSLKALSLVQHAGGTGRPAAHGLAYTLGVQATFLTLAGLLVILKAGGALVGWGFQLQEPLVVALLAYLVFTIGLWLLAGEQLMGDMERGLGRLMGLGQKLAPQNGGQGGGLGGSFATGVLAVLVASPCTAPFMAGAIGLALTRETPAVLAVFSALGLGLALPYLALSVLPPLRRLLPRPGPWMVRFRQLMGFPMLATAAWLAWVLAQQASETALLLVLLGFVAIGLALWLRQLAPRPARLAGAAVLLLALGSTLAGLKALPAPLAAPASSERDGPALPFSPGLLASLRAEGRPVFVNMTAAWCLTCLVNEKAVLDGAAFEAALDRAGGAYLKGDWTRRDPEITAYLASFGRAGVPLYAVYPPGGEPVLLPQILTTALIEQALGGGS